MITSVLIFIIAIKEPGSEVHPSNFGPEADYYLRNHNPTTNSATLNLQALRESNVVAGGVSPELDTDTISAAMTASGMQHTRVTRIIKNNGPTPLIRIFSTNTTTIASLLSGGLQLRG
ncbi:hypothetical protein ANN_26042 [Periplaneta americana]|uniref:Uncharacterized protein n=1 Tax=Periplaneta americana TaxID=6978 RepID=A0ABQ8S5A4_PERAM|nr:hypothetical protein ANN_26042 [Periplaneta americana]